MSPFASLVTVIINLSFPSISDPPDNVTYFPNLSPSPVIVILFLFPPYDELIITYSVCDDPTSIISICVMVDSSPSTEVINCSSPSPFGFFMYFISKSGIIN